MRLWGARSPPPFQKWTADDKARLSFLKTSSIEVRDTALGRHRETKKSIALMTEQELESVQQKINNVKSVRFLTRPGESGESDAGQEESAVEASADKLGEGGQC